MKIEGWNWKHIKLLQKDKEQKLKKKIKFEVEISTIKRASM